MPIFPANGSCAECGDLVFFFRKQNEFKVRLSLYIFFGAYFAPDIAPNFFDVGSKKSYFRKFLFFWRKTFSLGIGFLEKSSIARISTNPVSKGRDFKSDFLLSQFNSYQVGFFKTNRRRSKRRSVPLSPPSSGTLSMLGSLSSRRTMIKESNQNKLSMQRKKRYIMDVRREFSKLMTEV